AVVVAGITPRQLICIRSLPYFLSGPCSLCLSVAQHTFNSHRKNRGPRRLDLPPKQKLHRRSANTSLTWSHAAARLQLRRPPFIVLLQARERYILTAADHRVAGNKIPQIITQCERLVQDPRKPPMLVSRRKHLPRFVMLVRNSESRDLAFN